MKKLNRFVFGLVFVALLASLCAIPALALEAPETSVDVVYFEDGSSLTVEMAVYDNSLARTSGVISGHKTGTYKNSSGDVQWTLTVYGTFSYDGTTATATAASYGYEIYNSSWSLSTADAYCSGASAIATATFVGSFILHRSTSLPLTCSPDGVLS